MSEINEDIKRDLANHDWVVERVFTGNFVANTFTSGTHEWYVVEEAIQLGNRLRNKVISCINDPEHAKLTPPSSKESFIPTLTGRVDE